MKKFSHSLAAGRGKRGGKVFPLILLSQVFGRFSLRPGGRGGRTLKLWVISPWYDPRREPFFDIFQTIFSIFFLIFWVNFINFSHFSLAKIVVIVASEYFLLNVCISMDLSLNSIMLLHVSQLLFFINIPVILNHFKNLKQLRGSNLWFWH